MEMVGHSKHQAVLQTDGSQNGIFMIQIIDSIRTAHVIELPFRRGDDETLKNYLKDSLKWTKNENETLKTDLQQSNHALSEHQA